MTDIALTDIVNFELGIALCFAAGASFSTALGLIMMKIGIIKGESTNNSMFDLLKKPWWPLGITFLLAGQFLNAGKLIPHSNILTLFNHYSGSKIWQRPLNVTDLQLYHNLYCNSLSNNPERNIHPKEGWSNDLYYCSR